MDLSNDDIRDIIEEKLAFVKRMGLRVVALEPGYVKLMAPLAGNENHIGTMYAGALFTLAEIPGGALFMTSFDVTRFFPIVKDMSIRFRRPATTDITVELSLSEEEVARIQDEARAEGKAEFILKGELRDETGEVVALSEGTYQIRAA